MHVRHRVITANHVLCMLRGQKRYEKSCSLSTGTNTPDGVPNRNLSTSLLLMETLKIMEANESSSSDEENAEQNNMIFEKTASSAGSKWGWD